MCKISPKCLVPHGLVLDVYLLPHLSHGSGLWDEDLPTVTLASAQVVFRGTHNLISLVRCHKRSAMSVNIGLNAVDIV